jgi:hypothetical protein
LSETEWARLLTGVTGFAENPTGQMRVIRFSQLVGEYDLPIHRVKSKQPAIEKRVNVRAK